MYDLIQGMYNSIDVSIYDSQIYVSIHVSICGGEKKKNNTSSEYSIMRGLGSSRYGVAAASRLLQIIGLFCKRAL